MEKPQLKKPGRQPGYQAKADPLIRAVIAGTESGDGFLIPGPFDAKQKMGLRKKLNLQGSYIGVKFSISTTVTDDLWIERR